MSPRRQLPPTTRSSARALLLAIVLAACDQSSSLGSRYVREQAVAAQQGATITVSAAESTELAGASLHINPGDLSANATLLLELGVTPLDPLRGAGPVAVWSPSSLVFAHPVELSLPFTLGLGQSSDDLQILGTTAAGTVHLEHARLTIDSGARMVRFSISAFGSYQPTAVVRCSSQVSCPGSASCHEGECREAGGGGVDAGEPDGGSGDHDGGSGDHDGGAGERDAGSGDQDAGPGDQDAGPGNQDAGPGNQDAGPDEHDGGSGSDHDGGSGGNHDGGPSSHDGG